MESSVQRCVVAPQHCYLLLLAAAALLRGTLETAHPLHVLLAVVVVHAPLVLLERQIIGVVCGVWCVVR